MATDNKQIKEKISALLRKASDGSATAAEAEGAMLAARKLMDRYSLSEAEVNAATEDSYVDRNIAPKKTRKGETYVDPVLRYTARTVAEFCGCFVYVDRSQNAVFSGLESDVDLAVLMVEAFQFQMAHDWEVFKRHELGTKRFVDITDARRSFVTGFTRGVTKRLGDWMYRTPPEGEKQTASTALVIKKHELARARLEARGMSFGSTSQRNAIRGGNSMAAGAGMNAANSANVGRAVGGGVKMIGGY